MKKIIYLVANGDSNQTINQQAETHQVAIEKQLTSIIEKNHLKPKRAHAFDRTKQHGFIDSQHHGLEVFRTIPKDASVILVCTIWQCPQNIIAGLYGRKGRLLIFSVWDEKSQGIASMLEINGALTRSQIKFNSLWTDDLNNPIFKSRLNNWLRNGKIKYDSNHTCSFRSKSIPSHFKKIGKSLAKKQREQKAIMGMLNEGWKGSCHTIIPDHVLNHFGIFKERICLSKFSREVELVSDAEAKRTFQWLKKKGVAATHNTKVSTQNDKLSEHLLNQIRRYIGVVRLAHQFGCSIIGIQRRPEKLIPKSKNEIYEPLLNNVDRPPVYARGTRKEIFSGRAIPFFPDVNEFSAIDALITNNVWNELGFAPETWAYQLYWGLHIDTEENMVFVWTLITPETPPPVHLEDHFNSIHRTTKNADKIICKPGWAVWSSIYMLENKLRADIGITKILPLTKEQKQIILPLIPEGHALMPAVFPGITRDQMLAHHKSHRLQIGYAPSCEEATRALRVKGALLSELNIKTTICGRF
ncbi:MAG: hypothetical protein AAF984_03570 [Verrucomicrobiota bacterium]